VRRSCGSLLVVFTYLWPLPCTALGVAIGALGLATGGRLQRRNGIVEFYGGVVTWLLARMPGPLNGAAAMTLGHVVLGLNQHALERTRAHELVHVRQYQRWGPLFIPAYLLCSALIWRRGGDAYRDNPFEREAYETAT
jgi:hypothetical protein